MLNSPSSLFRPNKPNPRARVGKKITRDSDSTTNGTKSSAESDNSFSALSFSHLRGYLSAKERLSITRRRFSFGTPSMDTPTTLTQKLTTKTTRKFKTISQARSLKLEPKTRPVSEIDGYTFDPGFSCCRILDDPKIISLHSTRQAIEFSITAQIRIISNYHKNKERTRHIEFSNGHVYIFKSADPTESAPEFTIPIHAIRAIEYQGQSSKSFVFESYLAGPERMMSMTSEGGELGHWHQSAQFVVKCESEMVNKKAVKLLLMEAERLADVIQGALYSIMKIKSVTKVKKLKVPHVECLLRKRVCLYRLCKLPDCMKTYEAMYDLAEYLKENGERKDALAVFHLVNSFLKERKERGNGNKLQQAFDETIMQSEMNLLKMEVQITLDQTR